MRADLDDFLRSADSTTGDDEHDPEGATIGFERAQAQAMLERARGRLAAIDAALARDDGSADDVRCAVCGRPIGAERLAVLPATDRCVDCARAGRQP